MMQRHSVFAGKCYRDSLGAIYRVVGFDGNGVRCVLYHRTEQGGFAEREHSQSWPDFLEDLQGKSSALPQQQVSLLDQSGIKPHLTRFAYFRGW